MGLPYARLVARARTFPVALALIALAGVTIRVLHTLFVAPAAGGLSDAFWYSLVAQNISAGRGFVTPVGGLFTESFHYADTAQHPPLYPLVLALAGDGLVAQVGSVVGLVTVGPRDRRALVGGHERTIEDDPVAHHPRREHYRRARAGCPQPEPARAAAATAPGQRQRKQRQQQQGL